VSIFTHIHYHDVKKYQTQYAVLTLNRPQKAQAYNRVMLDEMKAHFLEIQQKNTLSALIIQSKGHRVFCAGADLNEMKNATALTALHLHSESVFRLLENLNCVTIASIHGPAIAGGCELTLACDLRIVSPTATFSLPETSMGLIPAAGGCVRLPKLIGFTRSKGVILGGHIITATEALNWGLANQITSEPLQNAVDWAQKIATFDPIAVRFAKSTINSEMSKGSHLQGKSLEGILYHRKR
jgi:enoyl-CoA hydratase